MAAAWLQHGCSIILEAVSSAASAVWTNVTMIADTKPVPFSNVSNVKEQALLYPRRQGDERTTVVNLRRTLMIFVHRRLTTRRVIAKPDACRVFCVCVNFD